MLGNNCIHDKIVFKNLKKRHVELKKITWIFIQKIVAKPCLYGDSVEFIRRPDARENVDIVYHIAIMQL